MTDQQAPLAPRRSTSPARRQWGSAGELLTSREAREQAAATRLRAQQRLEDERAAHAAWEAGQVIPYRITTALDINELDGPGVDEACGVKEPAVDRWEQGLLYPTWDQLCALADLTGYPVLFFTQPVKAVIRIADTTLPFHTKGPLPDDEPVLAFAPEAIAATLGGYCAGCLRPGGRAIHTCEQTALF